MIMEFGEVFAIAAEEPAPPRGGEPAGRVQEQQILAALGGRRVESRGYFYAPAVLTRVTPAMPAFR